MYNIEIYEDNHGKSEIKDYIQKLASTRYTNKDSKIKFIKVTNYIDLLSVHGLSLSEPYIKKLDKEIWGLRPLRERILFANMHNNKFILLSIFMKETQKTPQKEIEKAKRRLKDYKERSD